MNFIDFLDRNSRYKSVDSQITNDAGLAPVHYIGRKSSPNGDRLNQLHIS